MGDQSFDTRHIATRNGPLRSLTPTASASPSSTPLEIGPSPPAAQHRKKPDELNDDRGVTEGAILNGGVGHARFCGSNNIVIVF